MRALSIPHLPAIQGSVKEWSIAIGGGLLFSAALVALLAPSEPDGADMEIAAAADPAPRQEAPPIPSSSAPLQPIATPSRPTASVSGLILRGVMGGAENGSVIVEFPGGRQASFPVGREILPGVRLKAIEPQSALLSSQGNDIRLSLPGAELSGLASATPAKAAAGPDPARQTIQFRTGLQTRKRKDGRITGFVIRAGSDMPAFEKAGLKPGDVVIAVNGRAFASEAEVNKLANEIRISPTVVFEYERNGKRTEARLENKK